MKVTLIFPYGKMAAGHRYDVTEEGRDFFLFKNGHYVPKNYCDTREPEKEEVYDYFEFDSDEWA